MKWLLWLAIALLAVAYLRRRLQTAIAPPKRQERHLDAYAVLGVARGATAAEISQAYREQMKRYHPDRVADLGEDLQRLAHEKTLAIQRAYDELTR
jgi:DnaJ-domain-containing protein 1